MQEESSFHKMFELFGVHIIYINYIILILILKHKLTVV